MAVADGQRPEWEKVPEAVRGYVEKRVKAKVVGAHTGSGGYTSGLASRLQLDDGSWVFVKGVPAGHVLEKVYRGEVRLTSALPAGAPVPRLLWSCLPQDGPGWVLLCLEDLPGGHPDLSAGSDEVAELVATLGKLAAAVTPSPLPKTPQAAELMGPSLACWRKLADDVPADLDPVMLRNLGTLAGLERTWERYARGATLLHTDVRADNVMRRDDGQLTIIDWDFPRQGAAWIEGVFLVPRLVMEGHTPGAARALAAPLLEDAEEEAVVSLAVALAGHWEFCGRQRPMPGVPGLRALQQATAVAAWAWVAQLLALN